MGDNFLIKGSRPKLFGEMVEGMLWNIYMILKGVAIGGKRVENVIWSVGTGQYEGKMRVNGL